MLPHSWYPRRFRRLIGLLRFLVNEGGALAISFAIAAPALLVMAGVATDYAFLVRYRTELQAVADAAATAGAREFAVANADTSQIVAVVESFAKQRTPSGDSDVSVATAIDESKSSLTVEVSKAWQPFFAHIVDSAVTPIVVHAKAILVGGTKICVLGLDTSAAGTVALSGASRITANGCAVLSNSTSASGLAAYKTSLIEATMICSSGGVGGSASNFSPAPVTDCPATPDPLKSRTSPTVGLCDYYNFSVSGGTKTLTPGTYCGGLLVANGADVTFAPGTYVIKDGRLQVTHNSKIYGEDVGFYLTGTGSRLTFAAATTIELYAPRTGTMAGLLFFEDRTAPLNQIHDIVSENARTLVGTIYLSRGIFQVGSKQPVADMSAYTAIVANKVVLNSYPSIVLNTNYQLTDVPVPEGLSAIGGKVVLAE